MADVRLTATNPEDSSVVPVACDASGRLLLEEQGVGPQGPQGPPGPKGEDGQDGDPFSGNFADDVTFEGSAEFAGNITTGNFDSSAGTKAFASGSLQVRRDDTNTAIVVYKGGTLDNNKTLEIKADGGAEFAGDVTNGTFKLSSSSSRGCRFKAGGTIDVQRESTVSADAIAIRVLKGINETFIVYADGSCEFAGGKAGFTAEGYLWCTTRRGDTVILDATSNGLANWMDYTPTSRIDEVRDKLDAIRGETGEMPADTQ